MKPTKDNCLITDVEALVKDTSVTEAMEEVWRKLELALAKMDPDSLKLLTEHFNGATVKQLSDRWKLTESELDAWLTKKRKELVQHLRAGTRVRQ